MFLLRKPSDEQIRRFLQHQATLDYSYAEVGATRGEAPPGYEQHRAGVRLGHGEAVFIKAKAALRRWAEFETGWITLYWPETPLEPGQCVAVLAHYLGVRLLNACRIVYVVDELDVFGFAYGALPQHAEQGEERFQVTRRADDSVWYEVHAFFRPNLRLIRLAWPLLRAKVNQFRHDSAQAMLRAVNGKEG